MSIEMDNPQTILEKIDTLTNLIEQMYLAHKAHNDSMFELAHKAAGNLGFELMRTIEENQEE